MISRALVVNAVAVTTVLHIMSVTVVILIVTLNITLLGNQWIPIFTLISERMVVWCMICKIGE